MMKIVSSRQTWDERRLAFLELLSEPIIQEDLNDDFYEEDLKSGVIDYVDFDDVEDSNRNRIFFEPTKGKMSNKREFVLL